METITEVIGLPGAGKTHYVGGKQVLVKGRACRYWWALLFSIKHPKIAWHFLYKTVRTPQVRPALKNKALFLLFGAFAREYKARPGQIIDEGLYQYILSLYEVTVSRKAVKDDITILAPLRRGVLHFRTDETIRESRMQERGRWFSKNLSKAETERFLVSLKETEMYLAELLQEQANYEVYNRNHHGDFN